MSSFEFWSLQGFSLFHLNVLLYLWVCSRLVSRLFFDCDQGQADPVVAIARDQSSVYLQLLMHETQPPSQLTVSTITRYVVQGGHTYLVLSMLEISAVGVVNLVSVWKALTLFSNQDIQRLQPVQQCGWCNIGEQLVPSCYCSLPCFHFIDLQGPDCELSAVFLSCCVRKSFYDYMFI